MSVNYNIRYLLVLFLISSSLGISLMAQGNRLPPGMSETTTKSGVVKRTVIPRGGRTGPGSSRSGVISADKNTPVANTKAPKVINANVQNSDLRLKFNMTPLEIVLQDYSEKTGKTLLRAPGLPTPTFSLRSQGMLSLAEYLSAIETVLGMHGVGLVATGDKFIRVVPIADVIMEPGEIMEKLPEEGSLPEDSGELLSQMIVLKYIDIAEATKAIQPLLHKYGKITPFERTNSILVTDVASNINRAMQILRFIDQPIDAREEPRIIQIHFAKASDIKQKLTEIIAESQKDQNTSSVPQSKKSGTPGPVAQSTRGVIRASIPKTKSSTPIASLIEEAERGIIRGKVQIVADERTNKLIIITRPENMPFFEKIVAVLDIETSPDVEVKVIRLEFAEAKEVAGMLNDLIGANDKDDVPIAPPTGAGGSAAGSQALDAYVNSLKRADAQANKKSGIGELSKENIKILSDERTNALILMASKGDLIALVEIIADMDMMLSQVLIEVVIIDVQLGGSIDTGVTWIQKSLTTYENNSAGTRTPVVSFAGGGGGGDGVSSVGTPVDAAGVVASALPTSGLGYFLTLHNLNINAVIKAVSTDTRTKVISTPILVTTDNTEAKLSATQKIYVYKGQQTYFSGSSTSSGDAQYSQQDIGLELTFTPHINENKIVMMEIVQKISEPGDQSNGDISNLQGKTISSDRSIEASIAVRSGQTIVLGGQVRDGNTRSRTKVPILGSIPLLGRLFNSDSRTKSRTETIVFITPHVMDSPEEVRNETKRRKDALHIEGMWKEGWSGSDMAEPQKDHWWSKSPKPRSTRRDFEWETSSGKSSRVHEENFEIPEDPNPRPYDEVKSDVDEFLRKQREKAAKAMEAVE